MISGRTMTVPSPLSDSSSAAFVPDLEAYFERVGYRGSCAPTLDTLHALVAAHIQSIPFENLDVLRGVPIQIGPAAVWRKLVVDRRGGYCFEQNGLFLQVLEALGYRVTPIGARVRLQRPRDYIPPRTHLFLSVEVDGAAWLADVGVGGLSPTAALRLDTDAEQPTPHEPRRIVREDGRLFHQVRLAGDWTDVCEFTLDVMHPIDRELANWFTSAHPDSHFRGHLMAARATPDGARWSLLDALLTRRRRDGGAETRVLANADELLDVLAETFGLRFPKGTRFGGAGAPWPR